MRARTLALAAVALGSAAVAPPLAQADTLLIKVSEVNAGTGAGPGGDFVELQMYAPGQNLLAGHDVDVYDAAGNHTYSTLPFTAPVANGGNQRSVLIGDASGADRPDSLLDIPAAGGAVCFGDTAPFDCASWGGFVAQPGFPDPQAANAPAITYGSSLTRSIAPGCPTLLEDSDDTGSSQADFSLATPSPRNNAATPTEAPCDPGPPPPPPADVTPPETAIVKAPNGRTEKKSARIRFESSEAGSSFACSRDRKPFRSCRSPMRYRNLDEGRHKFQVRAIDVAGNVDLTPAKARWRIVG